MDEQKSQEPVKQLTDKELEAILKKSEGKTDFPAVKFDEFTPPTWEECDSPPDIAAKRSGTGI